MQLARQCKVMHDLCGVTSSRNLTRIRQGDNIKPATLGRIAKALGVYPVSLDAFDAGPYLFNCKNGTLDLRTRAFRPHSAADMLTIIAGAKYDPAAQLTADNLYTEILAAAQAMDGAEVPETGRVLVVTPAIYVLMKKCKDIVMETDVGNDLRRKGVIGILDGMSVQKIPANRLPANFGFMAAHPCATVAPTKLEDYIIHENPPGISGALVEGRIVYDAFVLDNKAKTSYHQALAG